MKKFILLLIIAFTIGPISVYCQDSIIVHISEVDSTNHNPYSTLTASSIQTGILYVLGGFPYIDAQKYCYTDSVFDPSLIDDISNVTFLDTGSVQSFKQVYFEMYNSYLTEPTIPKQNELDSIANIYLKSKIIPLGIYSFSYNKIKDDAIEKGLLEISDGQLYETSLAKSESPYVQYVTTVASTFKDYTYSFVNNFYIGPEFLHGNNISLSDRIFIDFDNGSGFREVSLGSTVTVTYSYTGKKNIKVIVLKDGGFIRHATSFTFWVRPSSMPKEDVVVNVKSSIPWGSYYPSYEKIILYNLGNNGALPLSKPLILVDGFDPENTTNYEELYEMVSKYDLAYNIRAMGYDLIIMNFDNGSDYIQHNAMALIDMINWVNNNKTSEEHIVIVGGSMGGLVARYALTYMEYRQWNHDCRLFISFDSPQQGANVPLGDQYCFDFFAFKAYMAQVAVKAIKSPAAQQMLYYNYNPGSHLIKNNLYTEIKNIGDYPQNTLTRKIAVSNGNGEGLLQMGNTDRMGFGTRIVHWDYSAPIVPDPYIYAWSMPNGKGVTNIPVWPYQLEGQKVFDGFIYTDLWFDVIPNSWKSTTVTVDSAIPYDNAPGGTRYTQAQIDSADTGGKGDVLTEYPRHCFIPTVSALDLRDPSTNLPMHPLTDISVTPFTTPFDAIYYDRNVENQPHVSITPGIRDFIIQQLNYREPAPANFKCVLFSTNQLIFEWDPVSNPIDYRFYYSHKVDGSWVNEHILLNSTTPTVDGKIMFVFDINNGLPQNWNEYRFSATATCKGGETNFSNWSSFVDYPTNIYALVNDPTSVKLFWTDRSNEEEGFGIWWHDGETSYSVSPNLIVNATPDILGKDSCVIDGLILGKTYTFMIKAKRSGMYSSYDKEATVVLSVPPRPDQFTAIFHAPFTSNDTIPRIDISFDISSSLGYNASKYEWERKIGEMGSWQIIKETPSIWIVGNYPEATSISDSGIIFNQDYTYRVRGYNGCGYSDYSEEIAVPVYYQAPSNVAAEVQNNAINLTWKDNSTIETGTIIQIWEAGGDTFTISVGPNAVSYNITGYLDGFHYVYLKPLCTYYLRVIQFWNYYGYREMPTSEIVSVFIPYGGYTNYNNARRLFRDGNDKLCATFNNNSQIYWASSLNNGLTWSVVSPKGGNNSTIAEKKLNKTIYSVRVKGDSLLLDSLGATTGFGKIIKTGKKMFNPAIITDSLGTIYCAWAETVVTMETQTSGWVRQYRVSDTIKVMYSRRTSSGWEAPTTILPISFCSTPWETIRPNSSIHSVIELPNPSIVVNKISGSMVPHIVWSHKHWIYDQIHRSWACDTAAIYYSSNISIGARISASDQYAEAPCLSVNNFGNVAVTYQQSGDIYRSTNNGSNWSTPYNISNNTGSSQMPSISYDKEGNIHVLWFDDSESGFIQKTSTFPEGTDVKLSICSLTDSPYVEESIVWIDSSRMVIDDTLNILKANKIIVEDATASVPNAVQIFYRRYKNNSWSSIYRLTSSEAISVYPTLPLTDNASQMGFLWTEGNAVKYKRLPDLDAPSITVTYPNGGEILYNGRRYNLSWNCTDNRGIKEYVLYYTTNYLLNEPNAIDVVTTWDQIAHVGGDVNYYLWRVPYGINSTKCRFKIVAYDSSGNAAQDISDANFTINNRNIVPIRDELSLAYNNANKLIISSDGILHLNYGDGDSIYYISSIDDGKTWSVPLMLNEGSLPVIAVDSKNAPAIAWIKQWEPNNGGGVYFSHKNATGWSPAETLAFMDAVPWDYICGYSPPSMSITNDTVSLVYEKSYGGGIPPYISKGWALHQTRFAVGNADAKKDTVLDQYTYTVPPPWAVPTSATMATDYKGNDHIAWHKLGKIYYSMRKIDGTYSPIVEISGSGSAENPSINISGVANVVWEEDGDIYKRTGYDQKWDPIVNISQSPSTSMMPYICGSDILWTEDISDDYEVLKTIYSTDKMAYIEPDNLSSTDYASIFPHEFKMQTAIGTKTYCIWAEEIEPNVLWGLSFMVDTTDLEPIYAVDVGQETPSIFNIQRDGFIVYGTQAKTDNYVVEPYKTVDYDSTELIYCFENIDPDKKHRLLLSFYHETGSDIKLKPYVNDLPMGEVKVKSGEEVVLDKQLSGASNRDGQVVIRIEKSKGAFAVCGKILIHEVINGHAKGGTQFAETNSIGHSYLYKLCQNAPNPFNGQTTVSYQLAKPGNVSLKIYNTLGQLVNTLVDGYKQPGMYSASWNGKDNSGRTAANGVYIYRLESGDFKATKKMVVIK